MTKNIIQTRAARLESSWAAEFFALRNRDTIYHSITIGLLSAILTIQVLHLLGVV